jgi:glycosyltransferase involved in cell wall biosynthesis
VYLLLGYRPESYPQSRKRDELKRVIRLALIGPLMGKETGKTPDPLVELEKLFIHAGYSVISASTFRSRPLRFFHTLIFIIVNHSKYDICVLDVYSQLSFILEFFAGWLNFFLRKPVVMILNGGAIPEFVEQRPWLIRAFFKHASRLVAPSAFLADKFLPFGLEVTVIPNGMHLGHYPFQIRSQPSKRIIWLRSFHHIYQPSMAVEILRILYQADAEFHLTMIGLDKKDGSRQEAERVALDNQLTQNVTFLPQIQKSQVPDMLNQGDIFLNTTIYESFGISVAEAAACGLCVVTTNVGALPYIWKDGKNAFLFPPDDPQAAAAAIRRLFVEPDLAGEISLNGRKNIEQFGWSQVLPQWIDVIDQVMKKNSTKEQ